jgi:hypothetical protein
MVCRTGRPWKPATANATTPRRYPVGAENLFERVDSVLGQAADAPGSPAHHKSRTGLSSQIVHGRSCVVMTTLAGSTPSAW